MKNPHGFPHGKLCVLFRGMLEFALGPPPKGRHDINYGKPCQWHGLSNENQRPSQVHGHNLWLICEVVLKGDPPHQNISIWYAKTTRIQFLLIEDLTPI